MSKLKTLAVQVSHGICLATLLVILIHSLLTRTLPWILRSEISLDFSYFYVAAKNAITIGNPYANKHFIYPPQSIIFWIPFLAFDLKTASFVMFMINCALLAVIFLLISRLLKQNLLAHLFAALMIIGQDPVHLALVLGQSDILMLAFIIGSIYALEHKHERMAGIFMGIASIVKPLLIP